MSPVVRNAWDGKTLQTMAKNTPVWARDTHVAMIGQITKDELLRFVTGTELANGFFNCFMAIAGQRSKELPFGSRLAGDALERVRQAILTAVRFASLPRRVEFDDEARDDGSRSTGHCPVAKKGCSAPRHVALRRTSSASPLSPRRSMQRGHLPRRPRSGPRGLALQPRLRPLDLR